MTVPIAENVYWVGVVDWSLRHFHGHELSTHRGSSYNAYLVVDDRIALVDTVWSPLTRQLIRNIAEICDPGRIAYVVVNHAEVDHAGALPEVMRLAPHATVVVSRRGAESVAGHFHTAWNLRPVSTGDRICLGRHELVFLETPLLHWPDSMFTYYTGAHLLMPNDAFGQHYATAFRFNDQVDRGELYEEALKYFVNILTPFSERVLRKIDELLALGWPIQTIAPSHGVIWRQDPLQIVRHYQTWARQTPEPRAAVVYDTMWNATRQMAEAIGEGLASAGVDYRLIHAATADRNDTLVEMFRARTLLFGSPTLNNGVLPSLWPLLHDLKGLRFRNKRFGVFGSYGWSGDAVRLLDSHLEGCGFERIVPSLRCPWQPDKAMLGQCREWGRTAGEATRG